MRGASRLLTQVRSRRGASANHCAFPQLGGAAQHHPRTSTFALPGASSSSSSASHPGQVAARPRSSPTTPRWAAVNYPALHQHGGAVQHHPRDVTGCSPPGLIFESGRYAGLHMREFDITLHFSSDHIGCAWLLSTAAAKSHARAYLCTSTTGVRHLCSRDPSDSVVG